MNEKDINNNVSQENIEYVDQLLAKFIELNSKDK